MPFLNDLLVLPSASGGNWVLASDFGYRTPGAYAYDIVIPKGFMCDLASIPRIFQLLIPVNDEHREAAVLHDWLYVQRGAVGKNRLTRKQCDRMFLIAMEETGVPAWKRYSMYFAVRAGGWGAWYA